MKKALVSLLLTVGMSLGVHAAGGGIAWDKAPNKINDMAALQNVPKFLSTVA